MIEVQHSSVPIHKVGNRGVGKGNAAEGIRVFPKRGYLGRSRRCCGLSQELWSAIGL